MDLRHAHGGMHAAASSCLDWAFKWLTPLFASRDLKPENFLLSDKSEDAPLKATDFGLSVFYKPGQVFTDIVGSAYYVAPEVCTLSAFSGIYLLTGGLGWLTGPATASAA